MESGACAATPVAKKGQQSPLGTSAFIERERKTDRKARSISEKRNLRGAVQMSLRQLLRLRTLESREFVSARSSQGGEHRRAPTILLLLGVVAVSSFAQAQQYSVTEIPPAAGETTMPIGTAINSSGMVTGLIGALPGDPDIGISHNPIPNYPDGLQPGSTASLFQYSAGTTIDLGSYNPLGPDGYLCDGYVDYAAVGFAINASGQIAGAACATGPATAFTYQNNAFNVIDDAAPTPRGVLESWGLGINSGGAVAGAMLMTMASSECAGEYVPFLYDASASTDAFQDLSASVGCQAYGVAINDSKQVAGIVWVSGNPHGFIYSSGSSTTSVIPDLFNCPVNNIGASPITYALAINASGQVTGISEVGCDQGAHAFLYSPSSGTSQDLGTLGGADGSAGNAINSSGQITGGSWTSGDAALHAFLYANGSMVDLNSLISTTDAAQYTLEDGVGINDAGQILVLANQTATGQLVTLILTPVASAPNVVGDTQAAASSALTAAGFVLGSVTTQASTTVAPGLVISQDPGAGASVPAGSAVNLVVSSGVTVPNVVGVSLTVASSDLASAGLATGSITQQYSGSAPQGTVIAESPAAGSSVTGGTRVNLVISEGAAPVLTEVPNLIDDTQAAATAALTSASLSLGTVGQQASGTVPAGEVLSQSPAAGDSVAVGSSVNVILSSGSPQISIELAGPPQFTYNGSVWIVQIGIQNNGNVTVNVDAVSVTLNGVSSPVVGSGLVDDDLAPGTERAIEATFPVTVTSGVLKLSGTYTTADTLSGNWNISARVSVPPVP